MKLQNLTKGQKLTCEIFKAHQIFNICRIYTKIKFHPICACVCWRRLDNLTQL